MSYEQAIKHFKNHREDKFYQECGGSTSMFIDKTIQLTDFQRFINRVRRCGGIWESEDIYFSQMRDEYSAAFYPKYPEHTCGDYVLVENWVAKTIWLYAPNASEFGAVKKQYNNWNEIWSDFKTI